MVSYTLCYHLDTAVGQVAGEADQAEFQRTAPSPPAKTDTLDLSVHPGRQPDGCFFFTHQAILPETAGCGQ